MTEGRRPSSRLAGFYRLAVAERVARVAAEAGLDAAACAALVDGQGFDLAAADRMIENVIGRFPLPLGIAANFRIDGEDRLVPMVIEEPSVVAAASNSARRMRGDWVDGERRGEGILTTATEPWMIGQVQLVGVADPDGACRRILAAEPELLALADRGHDRLLGAGGGARRLECRLLGDTRVGPMLVVHLVVDVRDAMGANAVNGMAEALAPRLEELSGGESRLCILSNLTDLRRVTAEVLIPAAELASGELAGDRVARRIEEASAFAEADPYRAATHNKGVLNGIDAVLVATGQDWRAVEAGAHAWAARDGRYTALATWSTTATGDLRGRIETPLSVGVVGGITRVHPVVRVALAILGVRSASDLARVAAAAGLAQNLGALHAMATVGIQRGHMSLHARNVAAVAGAAPAEVATVVAGMVADGRVDEGRARELLEVLRAGRRT